MLHFVFVSSISMMKGQLVFVVLLIAEVSTGIPAWQKRVVKGKNAPEGKYLWSVSLKGDIHENELVSSCGASIISRRWLLTAAHCFFVTDGKKDFNLTSPSLWHVRTGTRRLETNYVTGEHETENAEIIPDEEWDKKRIKRFYKSYIHTHLSKIFIHPRYHKDSIEWDIALLKLDRPIEDKYFPRSIEVINLPDESDSESWPRIEQLCVLIGWGCRYKDGPISSVAQMATLKVLTNDRCDEIYEQGADLNDEHEFCAGQYLSGHGLCSGDSGSGLGCLKNGKWVLAGIASATHEESPGKYPAIFTRVSYFMPWINRVMLEN